jgi:hypothetical protein
MTAIAAAGLTVFFTRCHLLSQAAASRAAAPGTLLLSVCRGAPTFLLPMCLMVPRIALVAVCRFDCPTPSMIGETRRIWTHCSGLSDGQHRSAAKLPSGADYSTSQGECQPPAKPGLPASVCRIAAGPRSSFTTRKPYATERAGRGCSERLCSRNRSAMMLSCSIVCIASRPQVGVAQRAVSLLSPFPSRLGREFRWDDTLGDAGDSPAGNLVSCLQHGELRQEQTDRGFSSPILVGTGLG